MRWENRESIARLAQLHNKRNRDVAPPCARTVQTSCGKDWCHSVPKGTIIYSTVTFTAADGMPFATTTSVLAPFSVRVGTSKYVHTDCVPVATPIVL